MAQKPTPAKPSLKQRLQQAINNAWNDEELIDKVQAIVGTA
jgi:hypothetical protein